MGHNARTLIWFRDDLRVSDQPALAAAIARGQPVIALYVFNTMGDTRAPGAAFRWKLHGALHNLQAALATLNIPLVLQDGDAAEELETLIQAQRVNAVFWSRRYAPDAVAQDKTIMARLKSLGTTVESFNSKLLAEPWTVKTGAGGSFKVFTPFCRAARSRHSDLRPRPAPDAAIPWEMPPGLGDDLESWGLTSILSRMDGTRLDGGPRRRMARW